MKSIETSGTRDFLLSRLITGFVFGLPCAAMVASGTAGVAPAWRTAIWTVALATMGAACIVNAFRCGRVHCYVTGPFLLIMAILTLLYGLGVLSLGKYGWTLISATILVGAVALCYVPELLFGRYRRGAAK